MENKINWWLIIGIVVIVAVITSFVTMQVTGNVVSVVNTEKKACVSECQTNCNANTSLTNTQKSKCRSTCSSSCSKADVYTKAEVDALLVELSGGKKYLDISSCKQKVVTSENNTNNFLTFDCLDRVVGNVQLVDCEQGAPIVSGMAYGQPDWTGLATQVSYSCFDQITGKTTSPKSVISQCC